MCLVGITQEVINMINKEYVNSVVWVVELSHKNSDYDTITQNESDCPATPQIESDYVDVQFSSTK